MHFFKVIIEFINLSENKYSDELFKVTFTLKCEIYY